MSEELVIQDQPKDMVDFGKNAAQELVALVTQNKWAVNISGHDYLRFEAWQTVGRFFGYTIKTKSTKYVEIGEAKGFEATASVLNSKGKEIGGAEALCLDDEKNWKGKPLYSLKSMAQTRAAAKALRQVLAWVVVLGGYKPTPAEEMTEEVLGHTDSGVPTGASYSGEASQKQIAAIFAIAQSKQGWDSEETEYNVKAFLKIESFKEMTKQQASKVIDSLQNDALSITEEVAKVKEEEEGEMRSANGYPGQEEEQQPGELHKPA